MENALTRGTLVLWTLDLTLGLVATQLWSLIISDSFIIDRVAVSLSITGPGLQNTQSIRTPENAQS